MALCNAGDKAPLPGGGEKFSVIFEKKIGMTLNRYYFFNELNHVMEKHQTIRIHYTVEIKHVERNHEDFKLFPIQVLFS